MFFRSGVLDLSFIKTAENTTDIIKYSRSSNVSTKCATLGHDPHLKLASKVLKIDTNVTQFQGSQSLADTVDK